MQIYTYLWKNKIISDFSIDKYIRRRDSGVRIQQSAVSGQLSAFSCQLLWLNVVRDSGLGISNQDSAVSDQLSAVSKSLISTSTYLRISFPGVLRSPQLFLGTCPRRFRKKRSKRRTSSFRNRDDDRSKNKCRQENAGIWTRSNHTSSHLSIITSPHCHICTSVFDQFLSFFETIFASIAGNNRQFCLK